MRCPSAIKTIQMNQIKVMPSHASVAYNSPFDFICGPLASRRCRRVSVTEPSIRESSLNFITYVNSRSQAKWLLFFFFCWLNIFSSIIRCEREVMIRMRRNFIRDGSNYILLPLHLVSLILKLPSNLWSHSALNWWRLQQCKPDTRTTNN